jgi:hypothetical protein
MQFQETGMWSRKNPRKLRNIKSLTLVIQSVWNAKTEVTPLLIWATGTFSKSFIKYPTKKPVKHEIKKLQKTALGNYKIFKKRNIVTCTVNCNYITATPRTVETWFVSDI